VRRLAEKHGVGITDPFEQRIEVRRIAQRTD
jgi:hypothetical protein